MASRTPLIRARRAGRAGQKRGRAVGLFVLSVESVGGLCVPRVCVCLSLSALLCCALLCSSYSIRLLLAPVSARAGRCVVGVVAGGRAGGWQAGNMQVGQRRWSVCRGGGRAGWAARRCPTEKGRWRGEKRKRKKRGREENGGQRAGRARRDKRVKVGKKGRRGGGGGRGGRMERVARKQRTPEAVIGGGERSGRGIIPALQAGSYMEKGERERVACACVLVCQCVGLSALRCPLTARTLSPLPPRAALLQAAGRPLSLGGRVWAPPPARRYLGYITSRLHTHTANTAGAPCCLSGWLAGKAR